MTSLLYQTFQKKIILLLFIILNTHIVLANIQIEITHGIDTAQPIAIMPFTWIHPKNEHFSHPIPIDNPDIDIASIINSDLYNSGKFNTLPTVDLLNKPAKLSDIIPMFWENLGIHFIVLGSLTINHNNNYVITYQLIDTTNNPALVILENQFSTEKQWIRYTAHTISDEIFKKLTGIKGAFCTRIAYIKHTKNAVPYPYELHIADYDGFNQISVCKSSAPLMSPTWSPDGTKLAYVTFASGNSELVIQTLNTGTIDKIINFTNHNGAPAFSPDGTKLACALSKTGSLNLYIIDLTSGEIKQLTNNRYNNTEPSWFPDNKNLAYTSDQSGIPQIYKININTTNTKRLSWLNTSHQKPIVSIDGSFILMISRYSGVQNIAKLDLLTEKETIITNTFLDDTPSIAPNNTMIIYNTTKELSGILAIASIDGRFKKYLPKNTNENIRFPTWSPYLK